MTALTAVALLAGCGASADGLGDEEQSEDPELGNAKQAITGGSGSTASRLVANDTDFPAVARLDISNGGGTVRCTSSRLGPFRSVTAAHCFDGDPSHPNIVRLFNAAGTNPNPISVTLVPGDGFEVFGSNVNDDHIDFTIQPGQLWIHPSHILRDGATTGAEGPNYYDVAEFKTPQLPWGPGLTVSSDELIPDGPKTFVGFGKDDNNSTRVTHKQVALFTTGGIPFTYQDVVSTHNAFPVGGEGDSGGPLLNSNSSTYNPNDTNQSTLIAIVHGGNLTNGTAFSRIANIYDWIFDPTLANDPALFQTGKSLFFYSNRRLTNGLANGLCLGAASSNRTPGQGVVLAPCAGAFALISGSARQPPGWILQAADGGGFLIVNRANGLCVAVGGSGTGVSSPLQLRTCDLFNATQKWLFPTVSQGANHYATLRIMNASPPTRCISLQGVAPNSPAILDVCDSGADDSIQSWVATR